MGFGVDLVTNQGIPYTYVKVGDVARSTTIKLANITIYGYYSEKARRSGRLPIYTDTFTCDENSYDKYFTIDILNQQGVNDISQSYHFLYDNIDVFKSAENLV
jgi:hypothetical protein